MKVTIRGNRLNDLSQVKLKVSKQRIVLVRLTAAKKMVDICWKPPNGLAIRAWTLMFLDIVYLEHSIEKVRGAKSEATEVWKSVIVNPQQLCNISIN